MFIIIINLICFLGLCLTSMNQIPGEKFPTTNEDLQGFWDMVMLQVDHVDSLFKEIEIFRANNWKVRNISYFQPNL